MQPTPTNLAQMHQEHLDRVAKWASKAVRDEGIDLKRRKTIDMPVRVLELAPVVVEKPAVQDVPIFDYGIIQEIRIGRLPPHKAIQAAVCRLYGKPMAAMLGKCRTPDVVDVRHVAIFVSRILRQRDSWPAIGRAYGGRDHTTIMSSVKRMRRKINNEAVALMVTRTLDLLRGSGWTVPDSLEQAMLPFPPLPVDEVAPLEKPPQTHCKNGHEFSEDNTLNRVSGSRRWRICKRCNHEYERARGAARRERQRSFAASSSNGEPL